LSGVVPTKLIAAMLGLSAFAIAIVAGLAAGNDASRVLSQAIVCMVVCQMVGWGVGLAGERVVSEYLESYRAARPLPDAGAGAGTKSESQNHPS
jgi:putative Mn2+ efflux pump MntP